MRYSAVVPVYNGEKYIAHALRSLLEQDLPAAEIIVVNDGSTDGTAAIVQDLARRHSRLRVYSLVENSGVSRARNFGIAKASSPWCLLLDADDLAAPELAFVYAKEWKLVRKSGIEPDMLFCATVQIDGNGQIIGGENRFRPASPGEMQGYFFVRNPVSTSGVMIRRELVLTLGGFDTGLRYSEDWELWIRVAISHAIHYVDRVLCHVRRHDGNASVAVGQMLSGERRILSRYDLSDIKKALFRRKEPADRNWIDLASIAFRLDRWEEGYHCLERVEEASSTLDFNKGLYYLKMGQVAEAAAWFSRAVEKDGHHAAAVNNYAGCLWAMDRKEEAGQMIEKLVRQFPGYMDAAHNMRIMQGRREQLAYKFTWRELRSVLTVYHQEHH